MRYITDAKEAKQIDNISINEIGIPSLVLMERAALGVVGEIEKVYGKLSANACVKRKTEDNFLNSQRCKKSVELKNVNSKILVVAGMGNNGADGVAAARMLEHDGIKTAIKLVGNIEHASEEMKKQLEIAKNLGISFVTDMKKNEYDIIVDAIDTISPKCFLIYEAMKRRIRIVSSMGAGANSDITQDRLADLSETYQ